MSDFKFKKVAGEDKVERLVDMAGSVLVVSKDGHLIHVPQSSPALKDGQRLASESDVKKVLAAKAAREKAEEAEKAKKSPLAEVAK